MQINGPLKRAQFEELASDPVGVELVVGRLWKITSQNVFKVYDGAAVRTFADLNSAQTFQNKTLNEATFTQIATPSNPAAGFSKLYPKTDGKFYTLDSAGNEAAVGSGSGGGVDNLIVNGSADDTASSIFVPYADAAGTRPVDGTGGSPTVTTAITTTNPLNKTKSFTLVKPASNVQGQGWAVPFSVPLAYRAKSLKISTKYIVDSGTFVPGSPGVDGDVIVYLYDITNAQLIEPSNIKLLSSSTTLSDQYEATFQTSPTGADYRLIFHVSSVSALAYTLKVDDVTVSPQVYVYGTPSADLGIQAWTVTGATGNSSLNVRRQGRSVFIDGVINLTGAASAQIGLNIPTEYTADSMVYAAIASASQPIGLTRLLDVSAGQVYDSIIQLTTFSTLTTVSEIASGSFLQPLGTGAASPFTWANGDKIYIQASWVVGAWGASTQMSDAADTRVVAFNAGLAADQTGVNPNNTSVKVNLNTVYSDTHGAFSTINGRYVANVAGIYKFHGSINPLNTNIVAGRYAADIYKNGVLLIRGYNFVFTAAQSNILKVDTPPIPMNVGDYVELFIFGSGNNSVSTLTINANSQVTYLSGERLSGPSAIAASESVNARAVNTAGTSISNVGGEIVVPFATEDFDTHNAWTTDTFTAPISGKYRVNAVVGFTSSTYAATNVVYAAIYKNGVGHSYGPQTFPGANTFAILVGVSGLVNCLAGDTISIRVLNNRSAGATNLSISTGVNHVNIERVGN